MFDRSIEKSTPAIPAEFQQAFGPPPIHKPEDEKYYNQILRGIFNEVNPQSFIERLLVRDLVDHLYEIHWLRGLRPGLIDQARHTDLTPSTQFAASAAAKSGTEAKGAPQAPGQAAAVFKQWIGPYEQLERCLTVAERKLTDTLELLDEYRQGLGQQFRKPTGEIVDLDFEEAETLPLEGQATPPAFASTEAGVGFPPAPELAPRGKSVSPGMEPSASPQLMPSSILPTREETSAPVAEKRVRPRDDGNRTTPRDITPDTPRS